MPLSSATIHNGTLLKCCHDGCAAEISAAELKLTDLTAELTLTCEEKHISRLIYHLDGKEAVPVSKAPSHTNIRTKVSGVTFDNADGTSRQAILRHIKPGDEVSVRMGKDKVIYVKHELGVIGTLKREVLPMSLDEAAPELSGKVIQVTGGSDDKPTLGCNIEITSSIPNQQGHPEGNSPGGHKASFSGVFMDPEGRNIFHNNKFCSGMQNAKPVSLKYARSVRARPCKKCAAEHAAPTERK